VDSGLTQKDVRKVAIIQSNYIPWKGYFDLMARADVLVIYDEVQYTKNDWRNRNIIKTPNGTQWLTIPVRQRSLSQRIFETEVTDPKWAVKHLRTMHMNYAKAPFFKEVFPVLESVYELLDTPFLSEINLQLLLTVRDMLGISTEIIDSRNLNMEGDRSGRLVDAVLKLGGTEYISGPSAKGYLNEHLFEREGISVSWMDYSHYPEYPQLFPPFVHQVSVVDVMMNVPSHRLKEMIIPFN
jgi:hypothetical protein